MSKTVEITATNPTEFAIKALAAGIPRDVLQLALENIQLSSLEEGEPFTGVFIAATLDPTQVVGASPETSDQNGELIQSLIGEALANGIQPMSDDEEFLTPVVASHIRNIAIELRNTLLLEREDSLLMEALCKATDNRTVASLIVEAHEDNKATSLLLVALDYLLNSGLPLQATNLFLDTFGWVVDTGK